MPGFDPDLHAGALAAIRTGGAPLYGHVTSRALHHLLLTPEEAALQAPGAAWRAAVSAQTGQARHDDLRRMLAQLTAADGLVLLGTDDDVRTAVEAGFDRDVAGGPLFIGHFRGCAGRVRVEGARGTFSVEVGLWPSRHPNQRLVLTAGDDGVAEARVDRIACGAVWLRGPRPCAGAPPGIPARADFERDGDNTVTCRLAPP